MVLFEMFAIEKRKKKEKFKGVLEIKAFTSMSHV